MDKRFVLLGGKDGDNFHRSVLGKFASEEEAEARACLLTDLGEIDWWLVSDRKTGRTLEPASSPEDDRAEHLPVDNFETVPIMHLAKSESSSTATPWN